MKLNLQFLAVPALLAALQTASAGDITGTVKLNGAAPPDLVNDAIASDPNCGKLHTEPVKIQFYLVGADNGLKDVVVYLKSVKGKSTGASAEPLLVDQKGCEYSPYIFAVQTGQKITVRNSDPAAVPMHNVHVLPTANGNEEKNSPQMAGAPDLTLTFPAAEDFLHFKCDVHPWMHAYATVVDSPYFAVTDKDGKFKIANVPAGKYTIEAFHRKANGGKPMTKDIEVTDAGTTADFSLDGPK